MAIVIQPNAIMVKKEVYMNLTNQELLVITGGALTSTMINAITKAVTTIVKIGQIIGSVIRRTVTNTYCVA